MLVPWVRLSLQIQTAHWTRVCELSYEAIVCSMAVWLKVSLLQVDVYSFGVIMWEVVSHEQPARGRMRNLKVPQECPAEINDLINSCLAEDSTDRPSAREAYDRLKLWRDKHAAHLTEVRNGLGSEASLSRESANFASAEVPGLNW